jgi:hypothetical protein
VETVAPPPAPTAPGLRRVRIIFAIVLGVVVLGGAALAAALGGVFDDQGKFSAEPPACATVEPSVSALGTPYQLQQDGKNNCDLRGATQINVSYVVVTPSRGDAPAAASNKLKELGPLGLKALPGVGDEAYRWEDRIYFRVSNLLVGVTVTPQAPESQPQVVAFVTDVAKRLAA